MITTKSKSSDRRRAERVPFNTPGELLVCPASSKTVPMKVTVKDASATGVGVIAEEPLPIGQKYVVKEPSLSKRPSVLFTVVRSHALGEGKYLAGLHATHLMRGHEAIVPSRRPSHAKQIAVALVLLVAVAGTVVMFLL